MNSPDANDSMMNRLHLPVRERPAGANVASIADSFVPLKLQARAHSHVCTAYPRRAALLACVRGVAAAR